jgi:hypothetical protein
MADGKHLVKARRLPRREQNLWKKDPAVNPRRF